MEKNDEIEFNVGDQYENEKGLFEVVELKGSNMIIRWNTGETVETEVELQRRILQRRRLESLPKMLKKKNTVKFANGSFNSLGGEFTGLSESDFSTDVTGTHWRRREELGGAVTRLMTADGYRFNSWAPYNWPTIHWVDERHRDAENPWLQGKFIAHVNEDEKSLLYGFYIEKIRPDEGTAIDFVNLINWLRIGDNNQWLISTAANCELTVFDLYQDFPERLKPNAGTWKIEGGDNGRTFGNLSDFFNSMPSEMPISPVIARRVSKESVIEKKNLIAYEIAELFDMLLPVYCAAAGDCVKRDK